jgi:Glycosyl hydrolases family 16
MATTLKLKTDKSVYAPGEQVTVTAEYADPAAAFTVEISGTATNPDKSTDTATATTTITVQPVMDVVVTDASGDTYQQVSNEGGTAVLTTTAPSAAPAPAPPVQPPPTPAPPAPTPPTPSGSYILDENFTGAAGTLPDSGTWTVYNQPGAPDFGSNDEEYYVNNPKIIYQDGSEEGNLIFVLGEQGTYGASAGTWPSGRCDTSASHAVQVGQSCEICVKVTGMQGAWPACWFEGLNSQWTSTWAEIDMQESGDPDPSESVVAIWGPGAANGTRMGASGPFAVNDGEYHIYRLDFLEDEIQIFIDGNLFYSLASSDIPEGSGPWTFSSVGGVFVILNVAVSPGNGYGTPDASALPAQIMAVDYVRIWEPAGPDPVAAAAC